METAPTIKDPPRVRCAGGFLFCGVVVTMARMHSSAVTPLSLIDPALLAQALAAMSPQAPWEVCDGVYFTDDLGRDFEYRPYVPLAEGVVVIPGDVSAATVPGRWEKMPVEPAVILAPSAEGVPSSRMLREEAARRRWRAGRARAEAKLAADRRAVKTRRRGAGR